MLRGQLCPSLCRPVSTKVRIGARHGIFVHSRLTRLRKEIYASLENREFSV